MCIKGFGSYTESNERRSHTFLSMGVGGVGEPAPMDEKSDCCVSVNSRMRLRRLLGFVSTGIGMRCVDRKNLLDR